MAEETPARRIERLSEGVYVTPFGSYAIDFRWQGRRHRELLRMPVNATNTKYVIRLRSTVMVSIEKGTMAEDYSRHFPNSKRALKTEGDSNLTLVKLVEEHIETGERSGNLEATTTSSYRRWLVSRIVPKFGRARVDDLAPKDFHTWILEMAEAEVSPKSIRNIVSLVNASLNRPLQYGRIKSNPLAALTLRDIIPKSKRNSGDKGVSLRGEESGIDPFSDDEVQAILGACDGMLRALCQFGFATGLRPGELIALRHGDVFGDRMVVRHNKVTAQNPAYAGKPASRVTVNKGTKTSKVGSDPVSVPLLPAAIQALAGVERSSEYDEVFLNPKTGCPIYDEQQLRKGIWAPLLKCAGVRYRTPYQMRHTFASRLLQDGEPITTVAALLRHTTTEMIIRTYGRSINQGTGIQFSAPHDFGLVTD